MSIDEDVLEMHIDILRVNKTKHIQNKTNKSITIYKLGEIVANGIKYFGQDKNVGPRKRRTCMFICTCGKAWRADMSSIKMGHAKSCGNCQKEKS